MLKEKNRFDRFVWHLPAAGMEAEFMYIRNCNISTNQPKITSKWIFYTKRQPSSSRRRQSNANYFRLHTYTNCRAQKGEFFFLPGQWLPGILQLDAPSPSAVWLSLLWKDKKLNKTLVLFRNKNELEENKNKKTKLDHHLRVSSIDLFVW